MKSFEIVQALFDRWRAMRELGSLDEGESQCADWESNGLMIEADEVFKRDLCCRAIEIWQHGYAKLQNDGVKSEQLPELLLKMGLHKDAEKIQYGLFYRQRQCY
jgi:hypothetical protein